MLIFGLFRSVKAVSFIFLFWYLLIITAIIPSIITTIIGSDVCVFSSALVDCLIDFGSKLICKLIKILTQVKMYGNVKTHKINNPVRVITSGCSTAVESLSIFVEKELYKLAENLPSRIKDTNDMLNIIDNLNNNCIPENAFLISFDVVNMFRRIQNESEIKRLEPLLNTRSNLNPTFCILQVLRPCLECNNFVFNNKFCLQTDGTTQDPHMSCCYSDIAMAVYDEKAMDPPFKPLIWKLFRDDVIVLWIHSNEDSNHYLDYLNTIDASGKIRFAMETETENGLEFFYDRLKLKGCNKITVDFYSKPNNSFIYVHPKSCYPSRNIIKIPEGIALSLRHVCDSDEKYGKGSNEYQNYLIARNYTPSLVFK